MADWVKVALFSFPKERTLFWLVLESMLQEILYFLVPRDPCSRNAWSCLKIVGMGICCMASNL